VEREKEEIRLILHFTFIEEMVIKARIGITKIISKRKNRKEYMRNIENALLKV